MNTYVCRSEIEAWDVLWKWKWFTRNVWEAEYWKEEEATLKPIISLLSDLGVKTVLDCSCGLGYKTILFAKAGYDVEGSDASRTAIKYAPQLAREHGFNIRFFISRYDELSEKCEYSYDCVWSDNFDEISDYKYLKVSARSICKILNKGGKFIFTAPPIEDLETIIETEWRNREKFVVYPPCRKDSRRVIHIEVAEKTPEGILENNIFIIEEGDLLRVEIAPIMNPRVKWTYKNFKAVLIKAGFRNVHISEEGIVTAVK